MEKRFKVAELFLAVTLTTAIGACSQPNAPAGGETETTTPVETQSPETTAPTPTESPEAVPPSPTESPAMDGQGQNEGNTETTEPQTEQPADGQNEGNTETTEPQTEQPADGQNEGNTETEQRQPNQPADNEGGEGGEG